MKYFQCDLSQGTGRTTAYIEERGAKVGAFVEVKDENFNGLWRVDQVSDHGVEGEHLRDLQKNNRNIFGSIAPRT
ncbi:hypothetical protein EVB32_147 [Rhizobium phage RHph_TM39]|uniref:Uncharacterized protein n=2 Tax=Cuauhnahuacvirus TaxID=3044696 RepID=A0A7S5UVW8_9CAUD|nr:hypothetical protein PQC16_gp148 [Rhizobium phage RHph_TM30]YP_010671296.1 hypothetical protein PQC17_gp147 [Rhizobium phage RHph_Y65]QIG71618.1 hypothetical protein EVB94_147 [Rhizobium phage RHph_TM40]QIG71981.1 hypothetical protein EVB95_147 [Rhizobium phage RHph_TM2_3B]QIG72343.1 hypothetical protein EVB96_147 [Rhizobium phage RHph_TM3_3_6]QIG77135.1 hypothetical protein EVB32_147 [Rhizobium phage RHph_TM39]QIG77471.1 hypothetical protein EVB61_143 [Rhizobium phage RHph_TM21B]QIG77733